MSRFVVPDARDGQRLDVVVAGLLDISRSRAAARFGDGGVTLDGREVGKQQRVRAGQVIEVAAEAPPATTGVVPSVPPIRFEDDHLLVLAKPAGLVVHPGHGQPDGTLVDALRAADIPLAAVGDAERPGIVHRLDRGTSGLMVVAKTDAAHAGLVAALQRHEVTRRYLAVVQGTPRARRGRIEAPLGRDPSDRTRFAVREDGKPAVTRYVVLDDAGAGQAGQTVTLLVCGLETGRTHQIRVHLSALGHPLVADTTYRASAGLAERLGASRVALHAGRLAFAHPVTGTDVVVEEALPHDLQALLAGCGLDCPEDWWRQLDPAPDDPAPDDPASDDSASGDPPSGDEESAP